MLYVPGGFIVAYLKGLLDAEQGIPKEDHQWFFGAKQLKNHL
jgi:hypothetical protein